MGLDAREYMQERARQRAREGNQTDRSENDPVKDAYYNPKDYRREWLRIKVPNWGGEREGGESSRPGVGTLYSVFLVGIVVGFFITCLLGLLRFELFDWGIQIMKPIAIIFRKYSADELHIAGSKKPGLEPGFLFLIETEGH